MFTNFTKPSEWWYSMAKVCLLQLFPLLLVVLDLVAAQASPKPIPSSSK